MVKLFTNKQLDEAINNLLNDKCAKSFNGLSIEKQKHNDAIHRYLEGKGVVKIHEAGGHIICASLTDYGLSLKFEGGFSSSDKEYRKKNYNKMGREIIIAVIGALIGAIIQYVIT